MIYQLFTNASKKNDDIVMICLEYHLSFFANTPFKVLWIRNYIDSSSTL